MMRGGRILVCIADVLVLPRLEILVSTEEVFQGFGNHVRRSRVDEFCVAVQLILDGFLNPRLDRDRLWLLGWCFDDWHVSPSILVWNLSDNSSYKAVGISQ